MFDRRSLYALNKKDPDAIVYLDADGNLVRLVRENFVSDEEFQKWKAWSDADFHCEEKDGHVFSNHVRSLNGPHETKAIAPSPEVMMEEKHDQQERERLRSALMKGLDDCLTPTQRRRLWLHYVDKLTVREIANAEGVTFQSVAECIVKSRKKIQVFLKKHPDKTPF